MADWIARPGTEGTLRNASSALALPALTLTVNTVFWPRLMVEGEGGLTFTLASVMVVAVDGAREARVGLVGVEGVAGAVV